MGCDIHCYIEYRNKEENSKWRDFGGRINPGRNYWMFGFMAQVRAEFENSFQAKGIPDDLGYAASDDYWIFITKDGGGGGYCTIEQAESYINSTYNPCILRKPEDGVCIHNSVSHPDWHSHSWLTASEFEECIARYLHRSGLLVDPTKCLPSFGEMSKSKELSQEDEYALHCITEYWAILMAMRCFEAQGKESRLVFWFDN